MRVDPQHGRLAPLVPRASRASRASQARAPLSNVRLSATCASRQHTDRLERFLPLSPSQTTRPPASTSLSVSQALYVRFSTRPFTELSPSTQICFLPLTAPRPLLGALHPCPPIGRGHAAPPPAFPRFGNRPMMSLRSSGPRGCFGGKPRRRHAASPSVPRGV